MHQDQQKVIKLRTKKVEAEHLHDDGDHEAERHNADEYQGAAVKIQATVRMYQGQQKIAKLRTNAGVENLQND